MARLAPPPTAYFELPGERRQPLWRLGVFILLVLSAHLTGLFLAFGVVSRNTPAAALPALSVRVLELVPVKPERKVERKVEETLTVAPPKSQATPLALAAPEPVKPAKRARQPPPARALPVPARKASPTPPAVLVAAPAAPATSSFAVAPSAPSAPPAAALAVAPAAAAPAPLAGARFDADYLRNPRPVYPSASRRLGEEGRVVLRVTVSAAGLPVDVEIKQSSGFRRLDEAARSAVERWRFVPARRGTEAVESAVLVPLQFTLNG